MMNKKDFVQFARIIRTQRQKAIHQTDSGIQPEVSLMVRTIRLDQIDSFVNSLCDLFESNDPQFQAHKFIQACEIDTESTKKRA